MGTKFKGGSRNDAAARVGEMFMGVRPGGLVGVLRASMGIGGGGPDGGGVCAGPAYGFVVYDVLDVSDRIRLRCSDFPAFRLLSPASLPAVGDSMGERGLRLSPALVVCVLEGVETLSLDFGLNELTGGWLWNKQKT